MNNPRRVCHKFMSHPLFYLFIIFSSSFFLHRITLSYRMHSCCTDYARNLYGKRPMRSRRLKPHVIRSRRFRRWRRFFLIVFLSHRFHDFTFFVPQISQIYTDFFCVLDEEKTASPHRSNRSKSVKSVGQKKTYDSKICVICEICVTIHHAVPVPRPNRSLSV